ncbi:MAG: signal peptidase I [Bacilli bacterium]|nr:signal peptidase I [Bacilli bacterium]
MIKFLIQMLLEIVLFGLLFFNVFVLKSLDLTIPLVIVGAFLILLLTIIRYRKPMSRRTSDIVFVVLGMGSVMLGIIYLIGFYNGFNISYSVIYKNYIEASTWIMTFAIVFITEIARYLLASVDDNGKKKYKFLNLLMLVNFVLIDLSIATRTYDLTSFSQFYEFFGLMVVQSVAKNILLNYLSRKYGYVPCLFYRLLMDLYVYFLPITPKMNVFIEAVLFLIFPYLIYVVVKDLTEKKKKEPARRNKVLDRITSIVLTAVFAVLVVLVSREFEYAMVAIGSESMHGQINKGDAVIYKRYSKADELEVGDVIVFTKSNMMIVHRIVEVYPLDEDEFAYQTKGDANTSVDNWIVTQDDIIGTVKQRVLWIAWPSVLLNELF